jgi:hypothetical protein
VLLDAELLVRGLAGRLNGAAHSQQPWADVDLDASVYAERPVPAEQVINVLQPYAGGEEGQELRVEEHENVAESYFLISERDPVFITAFWPNRLSRSKAVPPPPALGPLRAREPCRWQLLTKHDATTANRELRLLVGAAALALATATNGVVVDMYGFPVTRPDELLTAQHPGDTGRDRGGQDPAGRDQPGSEPL